MFISLNFAADMINSHQKLADKHLKWLFFDEIPNIARGLQFCLILSFEFCNSYDKLVTGVHLVNQSPMTHAQTLEGMATVMEYEYIL